jgi:DNA-binding FadR family transcriptional regulator
MIKNRHGHTLDVLGFAVVSGRYQPGQAVPPEPLLCDEYGVSRTVVREVIKSLVAKGLVSAGPKVGTRVLERERWNWFDPDVIIWQSKVGLTAEFLQDLQDLRRIIEPAAVRMAATRATADDIAGMETAFAGMQRAVDQGGDYVTHDLHFHQGLLRASHNLMLVQMSKALSALLRTSFEISTSRQDGPAGSMPLHRAVLDAVIAKNPAKAERAILVLIDGAREDIDTVLKSHRALPQLDQPVRLLKGVLSVATSSVATPSVATN